MDESAAKPDLWELHRSLNERRRPEDIAKEVLRFLPREFDAAIAKQLAHGSPWSTTVLLCAPKT